MPKGIFILNNDSYDKIYGEPEREEIRRLVEVYAPPQTRATIQGRLDLLREADVILSGWGAPLFDDAFLAAAPNLKAVFYGAGSIRAFVTDAFWKRGILITSAYAANAVPVAEFALSQIFFCLKHGWQYVFQIRQDRKYPVRHPVPGAYGSTVGLISLGMVGRRVAELLKPFDVKVLAYDPFVSEDAARRLNVTLTPLDEVFRLSDVVSLHTPWLKETENMITGRHFASMKPGAAFINTARGAVVCEKEMIEVLRQRPDLCAVLDVTYPEPPKPGSPLYSMPNVVLTPHIAGAQGLECRRMGKIMVEELRRYVAGQPLRWAITREAAARLA